MAITKEDVFSFIDNMTILDMSQSSRNLRRDTALQLQRPWRWQQRRQQQRRQQLKRKTSFDVVLVGVGDKKIQVIKVVREITDLDSKRRRTG